mmetsp:Transcript_19326/g.31886  ORF Transcript_19326/g.31886 Transcript_19326/m.31886 type:complete len:332 (-) Transcript_19326:123-1118(-)|eukprot:jgi/Bigna1/146882/aug1.123_g21590
MSSKRPNPNKGPGRSSKVQKVKTERNEGSITLGDVKKLFQRTAGGYVSTTDIMTRFNIPMDKAVNLINKLLKRHRVTLSQSASGEAYYKWVEGDEQNKMKKRQTKMRGLSQEQKMLYEEIEAAGDKGTSVRDLRYKVSSLQQRKINHLLDSLVSKNLIKWVRTIQAKNKKIYMLIDTIPSRQVVGGPWYEEGEFDKDVVDKLFRVAIAQVKKRTAITAKELASIINKSGLLVNKKLEEMDAEFILSALVSDGELEGIYREAKFVSSTNIVKKENTGESLPSKGRDCVYRIKKGGLLKSSFTYIPCCNCPVSEKCGEGQEVNPAECVYFNDW